MLSSLLVICLILLSLLRTGSLRILYILLTGIILLGKFHELWRMLEREFKKIFILSLESILREAGV